MSKAMVVDDSRSARMMLAGILEELGYEVRLAANGRDALAQVEQDCDLSLFLVNWNMPEMGGMEFLKRVRGDARYRRIPVMMVTTESDSLHISRAFEAGANAYVTKPYTRETIEEELRGIWD